jgi:solute carrier family 35 protein F1/2
MLCLGGAVLFSIITVLQELAVKSIDIIEYLGMMGFFGTILCASQM